MPLLLAIGHVTFDRVADRDVVGGTVSYAALAARKLGWDAAILTAASGEFRPERELPGVQAFVSPSPATTRFVNAYGPDGVRRQAVLSRAGEIDLALLPEAWRSPDALLLGPMVGELPPGLASALQASAVAAVGQGYLREIDDSGDVAARRWADPAADLAGVHALFVSEQDLAAGDDAQKLLRHVPMVGVTRGWEGLDLITRDAVHPVPSLPREELDPTGAGDVLAATFLVRYHETGDPLEAAAFAACAASCCVEGEGASTLGDRAEVERRLLLRQRLIDEGEWE